MDECNVFRLDNLPDARDNLWRPRKRGSIVGPAVVDKIDDRRKNR